MNKDYYLQVFLKECKYKIKERKKTRHITEKFEIIYNVILVVLCEKFHFVSTQACNLYNKIQKRCVKITIKILAGLFFTALWIIPLRLVCEYGARGHYDGLWISLTE